METRVFSPSAYTFGEQRPHPQEISRGLKRKSESDRNESANGTNSTAHLPGWVIKNEQKEPNLHLISIHKN